MGGGGGGQLFYFPRVAVLVHLILSNCNSDKSALTKLLMINTLT